jgi:hypothetical protein
MEKTTKKVVVLKEIFNIVVFDFLFKIIWGSKALF